MDDYDEASIQWDTNLFFSPPKRKVKPGDLIIAGSDGLFDNLHDHEIVDMVAEHESISSKTAEELANTLFSKASEFAGSKTKKTPWAEAAAKEYGVKDKGGKPDDITAVVAFVGHADEDDVLQ
jgi:protein phosphatase PTC7